MTLTRRRLHRSGIRLAAAATALSAAPPALLAGARPAAAQGAPASPQPAPPDSVVVRWNGALLDAVKLARTAPPIAARAMAILHSCIYDAWAAYDPTAAGTQLGTALRRPAGERTPANKQEAISFAAYRALADLYPALERRFAALMRSLGYDPTLAVRALVSGPQTPRAAGTLAALAVLDARHQDGSNQLGDLAPGAYADYTGYNPVNTPDAVNDPDHWQPLRVPDGLGGSAVQKCVTPHWGRVTPFALSGGAQLRPESPPPLSSSAEYRQRAEQILEYSAKLTDREKAIAEYWEDGPATVTPPGHWCEIAQVISRRDALTLDQDVVLFFSLANALFDASVAVWDCKLAVDYVRPITAVRYLFKGKQVQAWGGPFRGTTTIDGGTWQPFQRTTFVTPPFPEFVSGHSTFSAAGAEILKRFSGSDAYGGSYTHSPLSSLIEPAFAPTAEVTLSWDTFSDAADEAGLSRRYGGIHFEDGDLFGRAMGRRVAEVVWDKAQRLRSGRP